MVSTKEVTMKITAAATVTLAKRGVGPLGPKTAEEEPTPKVAPISAPLPVWRSITMINTKQTNTCKTNINAVTCSYLL
jgi:hypothetical protein